MQAHKEIKKNEYILVEEEDLTNLNTFLELHFKELKYKIKTRDNTTIKFEDFEELIKYENPNHKLIEELRIESGDFYSKDYFEIRFRNEKYETIGIEYKYSDASKGALVENELKERIKTFLSGYSFLKKIKQSKITYIATTNIISLWIVLSLINLLDDNSMSLSKFSFVEIFIVVVIFVCIALVIAQNLEKLYKYIFPKVFFCLGVQKKEYKKRIAVKNYVLVTVLTGFVISIIVSRYF